MVDIYSSVMNSNEARVPRFCSVRPCETIGEHTLMNGCVVSKYIIMNDCVEDAT